MKMGFEAGDRDVSKVLIYPVGAKTPVRYEGKQLLMIVIGSALKLVSRHQQAGFTVQIF